MLGSMDHLESDCLNIYIEYGAANKTRIISF